MRWIEDKILHRGEFAMGKTCCVTGHRTIPSESVEAVEAELRAEVMLAIDDGYTHFISGFARGTDLMFMKVLAGEKVKNPALVLEAAIPYAGRLNTPDKLFHELIELCDIVEVKCENYAPSCFMIRNRSMVDNSQRVIAVYDGRNKGGTAWTVKYARKQNREIRLIKLTQA